MKQYLLKNGESFLIRNAKRSDAKKILDYVQTISGETDFLTFGPGEFRLTTAQEENFLDSISKQKNALYIVAEIDGKVVGSLNFTAGTRPRTEHIGEFGVSVLKEYWGNGIGTELIRYLIEWSNHTRLVRKIDLIVRQDNDSAIRLYQKLGFTEEGVITRELQINGRFYDALRMGMAID